MNASSQNRRGTKFSLVCVLLGWVVAIAAAAAELVWRGSIVSFEPEGELLPTTPGSWLAAVVFLLWFVGGVGGIAALISARRRHRETGEPRDVRNSVIAWSAVILGLPLAFVPYYVVRDRWPFATGALVFLGSLSTFLSSFGRKPRI